MKASELRIGNYIQYQSGGNIVQVESIINDLINPYTYEGIESSGIYVPILLTEDWLVKFGLKSNSDKSIWDLIERPQWDDITVRTYGNSWIPAQQVFSIWCGDQPMMDTALNFVHQLQNFYFAFKGEELVCK